MGGSITCIHSTCQEFVSFLEGCPLHSPENGLEERTTVYLSLYVNSTCIKELGLTGDRFWKMCRQTFLKDGKRKGCLSGNISMSITGTCTSLEFCYMNASGWNADVLLISHRVTE